MRDGGEPFGLCWGQQWSWHEHLLPPSRRNGGLLLGDYVDVPASVDRSDIRAALASILSRHASLRSTFSRDAGGIPSQCVRPASRELYELEEFSDAGRCSAWLQRPLDIEAGWPLRAAVLRSDGGPRRLGITVHHIAADRYGFLVLREELRHALDALAARAAPSLPEVGRQPAAMAAFERSADGRTVNERALAYWQAQDEPLAEVLDALRRRYGEPAEVMHVARVASAGGARRMSDLAGAAGCSEPTVAIAAVACVVAGYLGRATFPMTMLVNNRHLPGLAGSVCSVAQSGLICASVPDPDDVESAIPEAWSAMLEAIQHAYYDGDELSERMSAFDSGGVHVTAAPPNVNVVQAGPSDPSPAAAGDGPWTSWVGQVDQRCAGLFFHARLSESHLTLELRAGAHLVSAAEGLALVTKAMRLIHASGPPDR